MPKKKVVIDEGIVVDVVDSSEEPLRPFNESSKEEMLFLYSELKRLGINSLSRLEVMISNL